MRILKGAIGCWLGLAAITYLFVYGSDPTSAVTLSRFAAVTVMMSLVPVIIFGLFEKPTWSAWPYVIIGGILSIIGTGLILAPMSLVMPFGGSREEWFAVTFVMFCASLVGVTAGGGYRLFAGAKPAA
jgi:hypothetical protein